MKIHYSQIIDHEMMTYVLLLCKLSEFANICKSLQFAQKRKIDILSILFLLLINIRSITGKMHAQS